MPKLNGTGPEKEGKGTGRALGNCREIKDEKDVNKLGKGMGLRRNSGGDMGRGKRLKAGLK